MTSGRELTSSAKALGVLDVREFIHNQLPMAYIVVGMEFKSEEVFSAINKNNVWLLLKGKDLVRAKSAEGIEEPDAAANIH